MKKHHPKYPSAIHESGHAVAGRVFGKLVVCLDLETGTGEAVLFYCDTVRSAETLRKSAIVSASGPAAARLFFPDEKDDGGKCDREAIKRLARELCGVLASESKVQKEIAAANAAAEKLVQEHREIIERLARSMVGTYEILRAIMPRIIETFTTY